MFWLKIIRDFIKILREGQTPQQIAGGFALGSILGFSPMFTLQGLLIWLIILVLNVNLSAALLALTFGSLFAYLLDPLFHWVGYQLLADTPALHGTWTALYNMPVAPLTRFNNTVVLGSLVVAVILFLPIYVGMKRFVLAYRARVGKKIEQWKIYQIVSKSAPVRLYLKFRDLGG